jgi:hypothetical protein
MGENLQAPILEPRNSQTPVASATAAKSRKSGFEIDVITSGAPRKHFTHGGWPLAGWGLDTQIVTNQATPVTRGAIATI